ncbi:MAG: arsenate reductase [Pseudomonadota bacterium]
MSELVVFGLPNCDSCRKARRWLDNHGQDYRFHDVRADGLDARLIKDWFARADWTQLVNKRSTTWRNLSDEQRSGLDEANAAALILEHPTLLRRPVLDDGGTLTVGFSDAAFKARFA